MPKQDKIPLPSTKNNGKSFPNKKIIETNIYKTNISFQSFDPKAKVRLELPKTGKSEETRPFLTTEQSIEKLTKQIQNGINPNREFSDPGVTVAEQNLRDANELPYIKLERELIKIDDKIKNLSDISELDFEYVYSEIIYAIFNVKSKFNDWAKNNLFQGKSYGKIMDEPTNLEVYKSFLKLTPFEQRSHLSIGNESSCPDFSKIEDEALRKAEISKYITEYKDNNVVKIKTSNLRKIQLILELIFLGD